MMQQPENTKYKYRDRIRILFDLLDCIRNNDDCNISLVCRVSNLSHYATMEKLHMMLEKGFIRVAPGKNHKSRGCAGRIVQLYNITEKGQQFHNQLSSIYDTLDKEGIDIG